MVKTKLTLFYMQIKSGFGNYVELGETFICDAAKVFNTVEMGRFISEFIIAMLHP